MRILHVIATLAPDSGGPATACLEMAQAVARRGHSVDIFTTDWGTKDNDEAASYPAEHGSLKIFPAGFPRFWKYSRLLGRAIAHQAQNYDLLHIHSLYLFHNMIAPRAAMRAHRPYIVHPHGLLDPYIWRRHRWRKRIMELGYQDRALREAAAIHYTSADEMRISLPYAQQTPGVAIPLGVPLPAALPFAERNPRRILFLSRLHPKKGLDLLVPAFARLRREFADAELVIAGPDDGALQSTRHAVARLGLESCVWFPGMLRGAAKRAAFAQAGLFVLPSYSENFGIALAEAMAAGLPVVTTDQVNIHDAVSAANAGIVVPCAVEPLAQAMQAILGQPVQAEEMGNNGRRLAAERYSWDAIGGQLESFYEDVVRQYHPDGRDQRRRGAGRNMS